MTLLGFIMLELSTSRGLMVNEIAERYATKNGVNLTATRGHVRRRLNENKQYFYRPFADFYGKRCSPWQLTTMGRRRVKMFLKAEAKGNSQ